MLENSFLQNNHSWCPVSLRLEKIARSIEGFSPHRKASACDMCKASNSGWTHCRAGCPVNKHTILHLCRNCAPVCQGPYIWQEQLRARHGEQPWGKVVGQRSNISSMKTLWLLVFTRSSVEAGSSDQLWIVSNLSLSSKSIPSL